MPAAANRQARVFRPITNQTDSRMVRFFTPPKPPSVRSTAACASARRAAVQRAGRDDNSSLVSGPGLHVLMGWVNLQRVRHEGRMEGRTAGS